MNFVPRVMKITKEYLEELKNEFGKDTRCRLQKNDETRYVNLINTGEIVHLCNDGWYATIVDENKNVIYDMHIDKVSNAHYGHGKITL